MSKGFRRSSCCHSGIDPELVSLLSVRISSGMTAKQKRDALSFEKTSLIHTKLFASEEEAHT
jgi:hypothetical protein